MGGEEGLACDRSSVVSEILISASHPSWMGRDARPVRTGRGRDVRLICKVARGRGRGFRP